MNKRRALLAAIGAAPFCLSAVSRAQQQKMRRVGFLLNTFDSCKPTRTIVALVERLKELGWSEGRNIELKVKSSGAQEKLFPKLAAELVAERCDVIVTGSSGATGAAKAATSTIPIVFASTANPMEQGFVASLARPGGNVTGLAVMVQELGPKRMQLLKTMVPAAKHFARLYQTTNNVETQHKIMKIDDEAARKLGVSLSHVGVNTYADIEKAFADLKGAGVDGINIKNDPVLTMHRKQIAELALRYGFALMCPDRRFVDPSLVDFDVDDPRVVVPGALMSYGEDFIERYRRAAALVDKVLRGIRPADIPVEESQLLELVINERTVKALGLTIPAAIIPDELIRPAPVRNDSQKPQAKTFAGCLRADRRGK